MSYLLSMDYQMSEAVRGRALDRRAEEREVVEKPDRNRNGAREQVDGPGTARRFRGFASVLGLDWLGGGN